MNTQNPPKVFLSLPLAGRYVQRAQLELARRRAEFIRRLIDQAKPA